MMASLSRWAGFFSGMAALTGLAFLACSDEETKSGPGPNASGEEHFRALENDLLTTCGGPNAACHIDGTYQPQRAPRWLGGVDPYVTAKAYPGILPATRDVGDSILLTQVAHAGPSLRSAPNDLYRRVADWILAEVPPPALPNTGAFSVQTGANSINLDTVAPDLTGARLTFLASEQNGVLNLSAIKVIAPGTKNIRIVKPFFVILPRTGKVNANPEANGFPGEITVPAGAVVDFFAGKIILLRWDQTGQLKVVFGEITTTPGQGVGAECTELQSFKDNAIPAFKTSTLNIREDDGDGGIGTVIGMGACVNCHALNPPPDEGPGPAVAQMDLRNLDQDPAAACRQARLWINFTNKAQSTLLQNPQGNANPSHPIEPIPESDPIVQGLRRWVDAERER
jgi:mono/diheme cytochrome c family protein